MLFLSINGQFNIFGNTGSLLETLDYTTSLFVYIEILFLVFTHLSIRIHEACSRLGDDVAHGPDVLSRLDAQLIVDIHVLVLIHKRLGHKGRIGPLSHGRQIQIRLDGLAGRELHERLLAARLDALGPHALAHNDADVGQLALHGTGRRVAPDESLGRRQQDDLLVLELEANLAGELDARGTAAGNDNVRRRADALRRLVQARSALLVGAGGLPRHAGVEAVGARGEHEVVVAHGAGGGTGGTEHADRLGRRVNAVGRPEDELDAPRGVLLQPRLDGREDLVILNDAGDDGPDGG